MPTHHRLSGEAFTSLARGDGDASVVRQLREAQQSKHVMLLHAIDEAARDAGHASRAVSAFHAGYELLTRVQAADPDAAEWFLSLPHIGAWGHDCLTRLDQDLVPDFAYLACTAAAAAVRAEVAFELDLPVRDGRVPLPGLGYFRAIDEGSWVRLASDGKHLSAGTFANASCADIAPDDGSGRVIPYWQGTPLIRAVTEGRTWEVLLETSDTHLDRYMLPMSVGLTSEEVTNWRQRIGSSWALLVRHHDWVSEPAAECVSVIVPMVSRSETDLDSATTPAAFGAVATTLPPDPVIMAETIVHEFQHLKLGAVMDLVRLIEPCEDRVYAPWRPDPRPANGLLQGVYAHLGVTRFWDVQRHVATDPDDSFRAHLLYERWRPTIELSASTLLKTDCLTPEGSRFVEMLRDRGTGLSQEAVPGEAKEIAEEVALDHWLTWQLRHMVANADEVADLADAYRCGEPPGDRPLPTGRVEEGTREVDSTVRSRLLNMRYLEPHRYSQLHVADIPEIGPADALLFTGRADAAVQAYRDEILASGSRPDAWIGLALAVHRLTPTPLREAFASHLSLMFDMYSHLYTRGVQTDPLDLAAWFS